MKHYRFAGVGIAFDIDPALPPFGLPAAFEPREEGEEADIQVALTVGSSTEPAPEGEPRLRRGRMEAYGDASRLVWWHPDLGRIIDIQPRTGRATVRLPAQAWEQTSSVFDQVLLPALLPPLAARGVRALHACAVDFSGKGVLVAGHSGRGKSSTGLMLISRGGRLVADDLVFLVHDGQGRKAIGLGDGIRAREDVWSRFPHFQPGPADPAGKRRLSADQHPRARDTRPVACVILGFEGLLGKLAPMAALPPLLSVAYHAGDEDFAVEALAGFAGSVTLFGARDAQEAANWALSFVEQG